MDECDFLGLLRLKSEFQKTSKLLDQLYNHQLLEHSTPVLTSMFVWKTSFSSAAENSLKPN